MTYKQDWLMRQIESMVRFLANMLLRKDTAAYEIKDAASLTQIDLLYHEIKQLIETRELCKAEDLLYNAIDFGDEACIEVALDFYQTINAWSDETLERCNFPRDEINDGLKQIETMFFEK